MSRRWEPKKGVVSCEKPRVAAGKRRSGDTRMGNPPVVVGRYLGMKEVVPGGEPGEMKHLSTPRRGKKGIDSPSSGERSGKSPNRTDAKGQSRCLCGVAGRTGCHSGGRQARKDLVEGHWKGPPQRVKVP